MAHSSSQEKYHYIAYVDESGDPGLNAVKPIDRNGSSEWMVIGATVISAHRESSVPTWVKDIVKGFHGHQKYGFHFRDLNPAKKRVVCDSMANLPLRVFAIASNKKNMKGYDNPYADKLSDNNWFYCWLTRLLLERVTLFAKEDSIARFGEPKKLKIEYSNRGGLSYAQMNAYYTWLQMRSEAGQLVLPLGDLSWEVMHPSLLEVHNHKERLGLHMADAVASAFFKACDKQDTGGCDPQFAKLLEPRMARHPNTRDGQISGYGVKLMPNFKQAQLDPDQQEIFRHYGYPKQWWAPDPNKPLADSPVS